jgi:hypothetical protein
MSLKSALQDLRETTLAAVSGLLAKLAYLGSLRRSEGGYLHWGMALVHGEEASNRALKAAHSEVLSTVLRTPISALAEDLQESSQDSSKKLRPPMSQTCGNSSANCFPRRKIQPRPATLIQC